MKTKLTILLSALAVIITGCGSEESANKAPQPPEIPQIAEVKQSPSLKASMFAVADTTQDLETFCEDIVGGEYEFIYQEADFISSECLRINEDKNDGCGTLELINGECERGLVVNKNTDPSEWSINVMGFPKKPTSARAWADLVAEMGLEDYHILSYDPEANNWEKLPVMENLEELEAYDRSVNNGFILYSKNKQFVDYPADFYSDSFDLEIKEGWNLVSSNVNYPIESTELFTEEDLESIYSIWTYDENLASSQIYFIGDGELEEVTINPNQAFWISATEDFVIEAQN
jgi:hypothetical protein